MNEFLYEEWRKSNVSHPDSVVEQWWSQLVTNYSQPGRDAHNFTHLCKKLEEYLKFQTCLHNANAFAIALYFQYLNYDPRDADCHSKNVDSFRAFASESQVSEEDELFKAVVNLLNAAAIYSTEEHKMIGAYGSEDIHYFLDLDMIPMGQDQECYAQHVKDVVQEYSFLDPASFKNLRQRVLQSFLLIPNIFATKQYRDKYEAQARRNIQHELEELSS